MFALALAAGLVLGPVLALAIWMLDQLIGFDRSDHAVYFLVDDRGRATYVGMSNDPARRWREHLRGPEEWRRTLVTYSVARWCRSERQARRVETRLIRTRVAAARWRIGPEIHNQVAGRPPRLLFSLIMVPSWLVLSCLFDGCRWHRPNPRLPVDRHVRPPVEGPRRHASAGQAVTDVTYERHASPEGGASLLDAIARDADAARSVGPYEPPPEGEGPGPQVEDEAVVARRKAKAAERAKRYRARKKASTSG